MLKWALTPRPSSEIFQHDGDHHEENSTLLTLQEIVEQQQLPCLVRLIYDDMNDLNDNYCLLLGETMDPYLIVSNETERFSIPLSFDGKENLLSLFFCLSRLRRKHDDRCLICQNPFRSLRFGRTWCDTLQYSSIHSFITISFQISFFFFINFYTFHDITRMSSLQ